MSVTVSPDTDSSAVTLVDTDLEEKKKALLERVEEIFEKETIDGKRQLCDCVHFKDHDIFNSLPNDKISDQPRLKAFADGKIKVIEKLQFV